MNRRLAAILAADVVGYSRLMEADEAATLAALKDRRKRILEPLVSKQHGRIVKLMGDGVLIEFGSAVEAVQCAVDLQRAMGEANDGLPPDRAILLRIGVNLGDVVVEGGDLFGDGVNVAARLEGMAEPGGICVSAPVRNEVHGRLKIDFEDAGEVSLKNLARPVHVFQVKGTGANTPNGARRHEAGTKPSIAILPFVNMSGDPEQQYFSDGITEDIITELSRFRSLLVIARNSSFQYRDRSVDIRRVGRELGAQYVLEGSVRRSSNYLRITGQLIEATAGTHVWSDRYDRTPADVFTVQDDVVRSVVASVAGQLRMAGFDQARRRRTEHLGAYDCFLRGLEADRSTGPNADAECRQWYEKALELDPEYAEPLAHLAVTAVLQAMYSDAADRFERPMALANKAVALDPNYSWSHCALGFATMYAASPGAARAHFEASMRLNPNDADQLMQCATCYLYVGDFDAMHRTIQSAKQLNPLAPKWYRIAEGILEYCLHHYAAATQLLENVGNEANYWVPCYLAACYERLGKLPQAKREIARALSLKPNLSIKMVAVAEPFVRPEDMAHLLDPLRRAGLPE